MDTFTRVALLCIGAYMIGITIYNMTQNTSQESLVTNALMAVIGGGLLFFAYTKKSLA